VVRLHRPGRLDAGRAGAGSQQHVTTRYFQTDNPGSIAVITDESGNVVKRDSYDAWGKRRFPNGADDPSGSLTSQTTRGFTGQEELTDACTSTGGSTTRWSAG
jgi:hypothetical protein